MCEVNHMAKAQFLRPQHPDIKDDMWGKIDEIILLNKNKPGAVITVLRECQNVVGYLPTALMDYISDGLNVPSSDVFGIASFYSLFSREPKGKHTIKVCLGTACYVKGIKEIINRIRNEFQVEEGKTSADRRFSLQAVRCLGACGLAPVMVVDHDVHGKLTSNKCIEILGKYV